MQTDGQVKTIIPLTTCCVGNNNINYLLFNISNIDKINCTYLEAFVNPQNYFVSIKFQKSLYCQKFFETQPYSRGTE